VESVVVDDDVFVVVVVASKVDDETDTTRGDVEAVIRDVEVDESVEDGTAPPLLMGGVGHVLLHRFTLVHWKAGNGHAKQFVSPCVRWKMQLASTVRSVSNSLGTSPTSELPNNDK